MRIGNPIYDIVFKYLMEDEESARLLIGEIIGTEALRSLLDAAGAQKSKGKNAPH